MYEGTDKLRGYGSTRDISLQGANTGRCGVPALLLDRVIYAYIDIKKEK